MFGFKKSKEIPNEKRMLSNHDIVAEIIDLNSAKKYYQGSDYKKFYNTYLEYSTDNEKYPTYNTQYNDRVLSIAYDFASNGFDFSKLCGDNEIALNIYNEGVEKLEDEAYHSIVEGFGTVIDDIADDNNLNKSMCRGFGWALLHYALDFIRETENFLCNTERLPCLFKTADKMYLTFLIRTYYVENNPWFSDAIDSSKKVILEQFQEIIDNESVVEYCLERFVKTYMIDVNASSDDTNYQKLKRIVTWEWPYIAEKYKNRIY